VIPINNKVLPKAVFFIPCTSMNESESINKQQIAFGLFKGVFQKLDFRCHSGWHCLRRQRKAKGYKEISVSSSQVTSRAFAIMAYGTERIAWILYSPIL